MRVGLGLAQPTGAWTNGFTYDAGHRLATVISPAGTFTYTYKGPGNLVTNLALPNSSRITNAFDTVGRLTSTRLLTSTSSLLNSHGYAYNLASQRTQQTRTDASTVTYTYDNLGQLKSALGSGGQSTENLGYLYDTAWNLNKRTNNGTPTTFAVDGKNQLTSVGGLSCSYDNNGNLTTRVPVSMCYVYYTYDDENQLTSVATDTSGTPTGSRWRSDFSYDGRGRLRKRADYTWYTGGGGMWYPAGEVRYVYDGMRVIQERNSGNTPTVAYTRGSDLSASLEGAGGIGGLLARSVYSGGAWGAHNSYHADGNGNVTALVDSGQAVSAGYRYNPYGQVIGMSGGSMTNQNVYRFSSKEAMPNSGLYYYGYRFYDPNLQRWLNRDPLDEIGFTLMRDGNVRPAESNSFLFVRNTPVNSLDPFGLFFAPPGTNTEGLEELGRCYAIAKGRLKEARRLQAQGRLRPNADKWYHCVVSCEISRACNPFYAKFMGDFHERWNRGGREDTARDQEANRIGRECGSDPCEKRSCEKCCGDHGYAR